MGTDLKTIKGTENPLFIMFINGYYGWQNPMPIIKFLVELCPEALQFLLKYRNKPNSKEYYLLSKTEPYLIKSYLSEDIIDINRFSLVEFLFKNGYNIGDSNTLLGDYPLHWAVMYRKPRLVHLFLHCGIDPNVKDLSGDTPLHMIKLNRISDVICKNAYATRENAKTIMNILLQIGGNPEIKNNSGESAKDRIIHFLKCDYMYKKLI